MESVSTYSEARNEYLKQLCTWVVPFMIQHYRNVWASASKGGQQRAMVLFQERCAEVPKWNQDAIDENVGKLLDSCKCDYLEELMAAVFIAHTKVLIAIRVSSRHKKLQITLPKLDHFIHRVFSECARSFWKAPYLFLDDQKPIEMQKNLLQAEALCNDAIGSAVRSLLPIKNILNEYLSDDVLTAEPVIEEGEKSMEGGKSASSEPVVVPEPVSAPVVTPTLEAVSNPVPIVVPVPEAIETTIATTTATVDPVSKTITAPEPIGEEKVVSYESVASDVKQVKVESGDNFVLEPKESNEAPKGIVAESEETNKPIVAEPEEIVIDTEPASVHFSNYDNVFDENNDQVGTFKYAPKDLEPGEIPKLTIKADSGSPLSLDSSVTELEAPGTSDLKLSADELLE